MKGLFGQKAGAQFRFNLRTFLAAWCFLILSPAAHAKPVLKLLTYDSLMAEGGIGREVVSRFEKICGCQVQVQVAGDAGQIVSRLQLEKAKNQWVTQVAWGVDQALWPSLRAFALPWSPKAPMEVTVETGFVAFDYGVLGWIWNPKWRGFSGSSVPEPPRRWRDLLRPEWKKKLLLQDPRTSSPGLGFVLGVREAVGDDFSRFFSALRAQWVTLAPGWSGAYGLFLKDQAPLVWSYTTSQAYHRQQDPQAPYQALVFDEGNPLQIEGALAIEKAVDSPESLALAKRFLEFLVSTEVQALVPQKQWMLPARKGVKLPRSFRGIPQPKKQWILGVQSDLSTVLREWETAIR